jgi:hypothetical protein
MNRTSLRTLSASALAIAALLSGIGLSQSPLSTQSASADPAGQSCWVDAETSATGCFATGLDPYQQIANATGTTVVAVPTSKVGTQSARVVAQPAIGDRPLGTDGALTSYILVTVWDGTSQTGNTKVFFTTDSAICNGFVYGFPSLGDWNDRIKSFVGFNGCGATFYQNASYGGTTFGPAASSNNMGSFNNVASSFVAG